MKNPPIGSSLDEFLENEKLLVKNVMKKDIPQKVYLIFESDWLGESDHVIACTLDQAKAEAILKKRTSKSKIIGENEDGTPIPEYNYWISEESLI